MLIVVQCNMTRIITQSLQFKEEKRASVFVCMCVCVCEGERMRLHHALIRDNSVYMCTPVLTHDCN